ncbi:MAG: MFS transporter [Ligilactobacillus animalis]|uniref:MFS transporter n=1 Tax=Ligilactobacillus animalis TaxID=1605 RepID=UPI00242C6174|nr:MFS transporter [Ligilactobacillus animalis]MCI5942476.1 MFS transporter [Ligilactobacillus animalis]MDY2993475.1 MFS transporter [Ligilactobacillus animalis]
MHKFLQTNPLFVKLTSILLFSKIGDRLFYTALLSSAALTAHSDLAVMLVSLSETLPLLFGFILGTFADRCPNKTLRLVQAGWARTLIYLGIGLIFDDPATLTLIITATLLNFCSDLGGVYSTALITPFTKILVPTTEMQQAQGFLSIGTQIFNVLATFLGSFLLIFISSQQLALVNSLIFLIVTLSFQSLSSKLHSTQRELPQQAPVSLGKALRQNLHTLYHDRLLFSILIQLTLLNGFFSGLTPLFTLLAKDSQQLTKLALPLKLALLSGVITVAMILGDLYCTKLFTKISLPQLALLADILTVFSAGAFFLQNIYLILVTSGVTAFLLGIIAPRFSAQILNTFSVTQLSGITAIINSCLVIMPPLTSLLFPLLANFGLAYSGLIIYSGILVASSLLNK